MVDSERLLAGFGSINRPTMAKKTVNGMNKNTPNNPAN
jgi:hypothetical protein